MVLYEKSTSKDPSFLLILLINPVVKDPLPVTTSSGFNISLSEPNTTSSPLLDLTTSKSLATPFTLSFSPDINGVGFKTTSKVGY